MSSTRHPGRIPQSVIAVSSFRLDRRFQWFIIAAEVSVRVAAGLLVEEEQIEIRLEVVVLADPAFITLDLPEDAGLHVGRPQVAEPVGGEQVGQPTLVSQPGSEVERRAHVAVEIDIAVQIGISDAVLVQ